MKEKIITIAIFLTIITSSFYFGFARLENFSGVDEPYWSYGRVPNFWNAIEEMKWKATNICDKPGITIASVSGAGLLLMDENPKDFQKFRFQPKSPEVLQQIQNIYFNLRLPVFLFTLLILPLFYFLIKKLLGRTTARFAVIFIGFSPVLLGISLIINSDAMLWIMTALSTLSLFIFLKNNQRKYLLLSGFFLGLSVITKYVANVLFVYFFAIFFLEYILHAHKEIKVGEYLKKALLNYSLLFLTAMVTAFAFFPATWVKFSVLINATVGNDVFSSTWPLFVGVIGLIALDMLAFKTKISTKFFGFLAKHSSLLVKTIAAIFLLLVAFVLLHVYAKLSIYDLQTIIASPKGIGVGSVLYKYVGAISADLYSLLFSISPLVLISLLFPVVAIFRKKELSRDSITAIYIILFILVFYLGSAVNSVVTTVRYQIMTYPLAFVLAAIGISQILEIAKIKKIIHPTAAYLATIMLLVASLFFIRPHFLAYASEILPNEFIVNFKGMGEGSFEAAQYLNSLPGAHEMTIWADKGAVCERFVGKCFIDFKKRTFDNNKFEYFVISTDRRSRSLKMSGSLNSVDFKKIYASENQIFETIIANNPNNFVKVLKAEEFLK
ncbi:MAG: hypothetical protein HGA36_05085 [Candidatus Moranbacteria bacterium]|nr:hypothetical protein [Candidatus Moranbacteria bacterium]